MKKGWQTKTIGDVCEFQRGLTYAKGDEVDVSDNVVLRATNIDLATNLLIFDELKYISDKVVVPGSKKVKQGSLMICMASGSKSHLGKVAFIEDDYGYAFGGFMGMLTPLNGLLPKYLFHLMTSEDYKGFIRALSDGANINNLTFDKLKVFPVPVPPLAEQQRIVGLLDEAFEGIATAKGNTEKNLQNARALFESHLQSVFTQRGPGWVETTIGEACVLKSGTTVSPMLEKPIGDVPYLKVADMTFVGNADKITTSSRFLCDEDVRESSIIPKGSTIFPKRGGAILTNKKRITSVSICADLNIMAVIPSSQIDSELLYLYFINVDMRKLGTGSTIPQINNYDVAPLLISFPAAISEQRKIVAELGELRKETQRLARLYERKLAALEALKKSLLHQAFSGEL